MSGNQKPEIVARTDRPQFTRGTATMQTALLAFVLAWPLAMAFCIDVGFTAESPTSLYHTGVITGMLLAALLGLVAFYLWCIVWREALGR